MNFWRNSNFNRIIFKNYDLLVNNLNCKYVWKCDQKYIQNIYDKNITRNHIEIGPGTGYFLKKYKFDNLTLIDVNQDILEESSRNLENNCKNINIINHNIFEKNNKLEIKNYNSIGINYVLHCVPNDLSYSISNMINNIPNNNLTLFGSTVIPSEKDKFSLAQLEIYFLNKFGIFNNKSHSVNDISLYIKNNFQNYNMNKIGNSFLFEIKN